jgi:mannose-1-phosphate guanylyltransferase
MRHAVIMAGGSGTRLWPMSRGRLPKQLIPFMQGRKSLLQIAAERLSGLVDPACRYICAGRDHQQPIVAALGGYFADLNANYLAEPVGRDTLNAVGYSAAVIARHDPQAVIATFTADHLIEPVDEFRRIVTCGFELAEQHAQTLVTFGIRPAHPATGYGYLQLGAPVAGGGFRVEQFKEKPNLDTARQYVAAGADKYLWNSGMFVWRASTLLDCIRRYEPDNYRKLMRIAEAWDSPQRHAVLDEVYPALKKTSVDYAIMEPASRDDQVQVAAVPMPLRWLDVGSWPSFAQTCSADEHDNAVAAARHAGIETRRTLVASSDDNHLIATIGCEDLIIIHTPDATLVCRADKAEDIKQLHAQLGQRFPELL